MDIELENVINKMLMTGYEIDEISILLNIPLEYLCEYLDIDI